VLPAQVSDASTTVGGAGAFGCQGSSNPPTLTGGVLASADFDFTYDQNTRRLTLVVSNTSAVTTNVPNPLITEVYFNLPEGVVDSVALISQTGSGGDTPDFAPVLDDRAACHGTFDVALLVSNIHGGIANPNADRLPGPPGRAVIGPVTFVLELAGPGAGTLTANAIAAAFTQDAPSHTAFAAAKFQGGGLGAEESGFLGTNNDCRGSVYVVGPPRIGQEITICDAALPGCHDCLWVSLNAGPTMFMGFVFPLGLPLLAIVNRNDIPASGMNCVVLDIPNDPRLVGRAIYFAHLTHPPGNPAAFSFSDEVKVVILP
jgi:hypothetical protein